MNVDLELYRIFCEVVKYKNISKTAESMYISQSAVTQSIQKLEMMLGGNVFFRNKNGVELTEEGKNLYEYVKDSIETMNNAEVIFSKYIGLEKGKVRIGGGNSIIKSILLTPILGFLKKYPDIDIVMGTGRTDNLMKKLANGELDLVVLNLPFEDCKYSNVEIIPLRKSEYCFFCSKRYAKENSVKDFSNINVCKFIGPKKVSSKGKIFNDYIKNNNLEIIPNYELSSTSIMKRFVLNDVGVGFAKVDAITDIMDEIKIIKKIKIENAEEGIATLKKNMCNKATIELVKEIKEYYNL